jgi:hypothetical protein
MTLALLTTLLGDLDVLSASLVLPLVGVPRYYVDIDAGALDDVAALAGKRVGLLVGAEEVTSFVGTVARVAEYEGRASLTIAGGAGALSEEPELRRMVDARGYLGTPYAAEGRLLVDQILEDTVEELSEAAKSLLAGLTLARWHRVAQSAGRALGALARAWEVSWRVLASGEVWLGAETWQPYASESEVIEQSDDAEAVTIAHETDRADLAPGMTLGGRRVHEVVYDVSPSGLRATITYGDGTSLREAFGSLFAPSAALYGASTGARVVRDNGDGTADVLPDNEALRGQGGLDRVPLRLGIARARQTLAEGQRVTVRFDSSETFPAGDPSRPYIADLEQDASADRPIARRGDLVEIGVLTIMQSANPPGMVLNLEFHGSPYDEARVQRVALLLPGATLLEGPPPGTPIDIDGWILTGSPDVSLRRAEGEEIP